MFLFKTLCVPPCVVVTCSRLQLYECVDAQCVIMSLMYLVFFLFVCCCFLGRRHLQVRLAEPSIKSLNSGDCFALVTEKDLFSWIGKDCNPYEKAKVCQLLVDDCVHAYHLFVLEYLKGEHCLSMCVTAVKDFLMVII